jgi:hypothetical protein
MSGIQAIVGQLADFDNSIFATWKSHLDDNNNMPCGKFTGKKRSAHLNSILASCQKIPAHRECLLVQPTSSPFRLGYAGSGSLLSPSVRKINEGWPTTRPQPADLTCVEPE